MHIVIICRKAQNAADKSRRLLPKNPISNNDFSLLELKECESCVSPRTAKHIVPAHLGLMLSPRAYATSARLPTNAPSTATFMPSPFANIP